MNAFTFQWFSIHNFRKLFKTNNKHFTKFEPKQKKIDLNSNSVSFSEQMNGDFFLCANNTPTLDACIRFNCCFHTVVCITFWQMQFQNYMKNIKSFVGNENSICLQKLYKTNCSKRKCVDMSWLEWNINCI